MFISDYKTTKKSDKIKTPEKSSELVKRKTTSKTDLGESDVENRAQPKDNKFESKVQPESRMKKLAKGSLDNNQESDNADKKKGWFIFSPVKK